MGVYFQQDDPCQNCSKKNSGENCYLDCEVYQQFRGGDLKMAKARLTLSSVLKKDLKILAYLLGSWAVGLATVYLTYGEISKEVLLAGLAAPVNYIAYRLVEELKKEGYVEAVRQK